MSFGDYLAGKMRELDVKAAELARRAETSKQNIERIVHNLPHPVSGVPPTVSVEMVDRLAKALGIDEDEARTMAGYAPKQPERFFVIGEKAQVKLGVKGLTPDEQREIAEELALAYEVIMERRRRRLDKE